jgi:Gpi18-like mannosyltransferase
MRFRIEKLLTFVIITRVLILFLPWITINLLFPELPHQSFIQFTAASFGRWDAGHYLYLAQHWYTNVGDPANFIVFFPLYPLLLKPVLIILGNPVLSGVFVSIILFVTGCYYFYKLIALDYSEKIASLAVIAVAIFPTSYFFNLPYTESLFFLIFSAAMYSARKEKWILSGVFTGLGVITRPFGILLLPAILTEWFLDKKRKLTNLPVIILPSMIAGMWYLILNKTIFGDFFAFQKILTVNWQKHLASPLGSIYDSWHIALGGGLTNFVIMVGWAEALTITLAWILIPFVFKYLRRSWAVYYTLSIVLFSSTSFILSTPRYFLSIPPFFVLIALAEKNYVFKIVWRFTSVALLFCLAILFARGQWAF